MQAASLLACHDIESTITAGGRADFVLAVSGLRQAEDEMISGQGADSNLQGTDTEGRVEKNAAKNHAQSSPARVATFGPFCVHTAERLLERDGRRLKIGGRAFDILLTLVERSPEVVAKREIGRAHV